MISQTILFCRLSSFLCRAYSSFFTSHVMRQNEATAFYSRSYIYPCITPLFSRVVCLLKQLHPKWKGIWQLFVIVKNKMYQVTLRTWLVSLNVSVTSGARYHVRTETMWVSLTELVRYLLKRHWHVYLTVYIYQSTQEAAKYLASCDLLCKLFFSSHPIFRFLHVHYVQKLFKKILCK